MNNLTKQLVEALEPFAVCTSIRSDRSTDQTAQYSVFPAAPAKEGAGE